jgi:hypothetical protein
MTGKKESRDREGAYLGCQAFEESSRSLVFHDIFDDHDSTLLGFKVLVLYPGLVQKQFKCQHISNSMEQFYSRTKKTERRLTNGNHRKK